MERQRRCLVPLLRKRMGVFLENESNDIPRYIENLFNHFCDRRSSLNLSCIGMEIEFMAQPLREVILLEVNDGEYTVNLETLLFIFPNLMGYVDEEGVHVNISLNMF